MTQDLPAGDSHWDRLPLEVKGLVFEHTGLLTRWTTGRLSDEALRQLDKEGRMLVWREALECEWPGDLSRLPRLFWTTPASFFWPVRSRAGTRRWLRSSSASGCAAAATARWRRPGGAGARVVELLLDAFPAPCWAAREILRLARDPGGDGAGAEDPAAGVAALARRRVRRGLLGAAAADAALRER
ncbi:hypothetical protein HK105_201234 [Polyrhizophydium stewartii]|uniref:Uncharacterized protein n=1 Tax=Polyrhizophydium stewartii TaxID=2732419 RepID=A0ABR4NHM4_9FUNG